MLDTVSLNDLSLSGVMAGWGASSLAIFLAIFESLLKGTPDGAISPGLDITGNEPLVLLVDHCNC